MAWILSLSAKWTQKYVTFQSGPGLPARRTSDRTGRAEEFRGTTEDDKAEFLKDRLGTRTDAPIRLVTNDTSLSQGKVPVATLLCSPNATSATGVTSLGPGQPSCGRTRF